MYLRTFIMSACRKGACVATAVTTAIALVPAVADGAAIGTERPLAVSVPAEATLLTADATGVVPIRIVNPGTDTVTVRVTSQRVAFGDDGGVSVAGRDPVWEDRVDFPDQPLTLPAGGYRDVRLTVRMPARISPDLYFVGFLVTPLPNAAGNLSYINQIGSYITINVPGPRTRTLAAHLELPGFALAAQAVHGTLHIENTGRTAATYWTENDTTATPGSSTPEQERRDRSLLPAGKSRTIVVDAHPSFPIAIVTMHVHIFYPGRTDASTAEISLTKRVVVVQPIAIVVLAGVLILGVVLYWRRRRKRRFRAPRTTSKRPPAGTRSSQARSPRSTERRVPVASQRVSRLDRALEQVRAKPALPSAEL